MSDKGGSLAIAGFVYQFLNTIDRGLVASLALGGNNGPILSLEPPFADAAELAGERRVIQYKTRTVTRPWSNHAILFDVLPTLLRAALVAPGADARPVFVTSGTLQAGGALRDFLGLLDSTQNPGMLRVGHGPLSHHEIVTKITEAVADGGNVVLDGLSEQRVRRLLSRVVIEESVRVDTVRRRIMEVLTRATGSQRRATVAYNALFNFVAELSPTAGTIVTAEEFLEMGGLTPDVMRPIVEFDRRAKDQVLTTLRHRGYDQHRDVRGPLNLPEAAIVLVEAESGAGKTWSLAASAMNALRDGSLVAWLDRPSSLDDCRSQIVDQIWRQLFRRTDATSFHTLLSDVAHVLQRDDVPSLLVLVDQLPMNAADRDSLLTFDWASAGMRVVAAASADEAGLAQEASAAPVVRIGNFSQIELRELLGRYDLSWSNIPNDVRMWITQPMLAGLYVRLRSGEQTWEDNSEYELFDAFAERARQRGVANHVRGCRQLIAAFGAQALVGTTLDPTATMPPATTEQIDVLIHAGWLIFGGNDQLAFAHGRLRDWAVAEHLSQSSEDPTALALTLAQLSGYRPDVAPPLPQAPYALMDTLWLVARASNGAGRLGALLDAWDADDRYWQIRDALYRHLLATGGSQLLEPLLPAFLARLSGQPESDRQSDAIACLKAFADARQGSKTAVSRLLRDPNDTAKRCACLLVAAQPDPSRLDTLAVVHRQTFLEPSESGSGRALAEAAWAAIRACALIAPGWATAYFDREIGRDPGPCHLISLLSHLPEGGSIWLKHGGALVERHAADRAARYWLASCIGAFDDRRFDAALSDWCEDGTGMAALPAWGAVCRWRPDLAEALAGKLPPGLLNFNNDSWVTSLLERGHEQALAAVVAAIKTTDPSGCQLAFTFSGRAQVLRDSDIAWAAARLGEALIPEERKDLVATRLLDLFAAINDPVRIERLPTLVPGELGPRLMALVQRRIANGGLWHDPDLAAAETLLRYIDPPASAEVLRMQLSQSHPTLRWNAVRDAGLADLAAIRPELEAIALADHAADEPGRCQALEMLAECDPDWCCTHVRDLLAAGTPSDLNHAFWLAQRIPGDDFVADAEARIPNIFVGTQPLYRLPDYLLSRCAGLAQLSDELVPALSSQPSDTNWIERVLAVLDQPGADAALLAIAETTTEPLKRAELGFWGTVRRPDQPVWPALAAGAVGTIPTRSLRHVRWFYQYAASHEGPAHDQLLSDAYPVKAAQYHRALSAIEAIASVDLGLAHDALGSLCRLMTAKTPELQKLAEALSLGTIAGGRTIVFRNSVHWPVKELRLALTPDGWPWEETLIATVEASLNSPDEQQRSAACACMPIVLNRPPTPALLGDPDRGVREAAQRAMKLYDKRQDALRLLETMRAGPPAHSRHAATILLAMVEHTETVNGTLPFSKPEFLAAAPPGSGLHWAYPGSS